MRRPTGGQTRTNALIYLDDKGTKVVVASKAGDPKPPAWLLNLQANPDVEYQLNRDRIPATAEVLEKNHPDYNRLWQEHNEQNAGRYDEYQSMTDRPIPLVRIVPKP